MSFHRSEIIYFIRNSQWGCRNSKYEDLSQRSQRVWAGPGRKDKKNDCKVLNIAPGVMDSGIMILGIIIP